MNKHIATAAGGLAALTMLAGCAAPSPTTYDNIDDLYSAFNDAGGSCEPDRDPTTWENGGTALFCNDNEIVLIVFDSAIAFDGYVDLIEEESPQAEGLLGENWMIVGDDIAVDGGELGGERWAADA